MRSKRSLLWLCYAIFAAITIQPAMAQVQDEGEKEKVNVEKRTMAEMRIERMLASIDTLQANIFETQAYLNANSDKIPAVQKAELEKNLKEMKVQLDELQAEVKKMQPSKKYMKISEDGLCFNFKENDSTKAEKKMSKNFKTAVFGLDFGFNTFLDNGSITLSAANKPLELTPFRSLDWRISIFKNGVNIAAHKLYFTYGLAVDLHRLRFKNNLMLEENRENFTYVRDSFTNIKKSNLNLSYLTLPAMLYFETDPFHPGSSFRIGVGGYAGLLIASNNKYVTKEEKRAVKIKDDFSLNPYVYGLAAEIGFSRVDLYVKYALSSLFEQNKGPELTTLSFGIKMLNDFSWD